MADHLVLIHGRAQENKDAQALKDSWVESLRKGLGKSNLTLPIVETDIKFPYFGQSLFDRVSGKPEDQVAEIIIKGPQASTAERDFMLAVLKEVAREKGVTEAEIMAVADSAVIQKGIQNWESVQRILKALDRHVPPASTASIAIATQDVYKYLFNPNVTEPIDTGIRKAMTANIATVVVSHSLGTVVAFKMLKEMAQGAGWKVPLFVTLGSPLAVTAIRKRLLPLKHPACVGTWFNAMDPRDLVSLYPLDSANFKIDPEVENKTDVDNFTDNRHGIAGYLEDPVVARRIRDALLA
jgi:hypothetical protein